MKHSKWTTSDIIGIVVYAILIILAISFFVSQSMSDDPWIVDGEYKHIINPDRRWDGDTVRVNDQGQPDNNEQGEN